MTSSTCCSDNTDFHAGMEVPGKPSRITVLRRVLVMQERKRLTHAVLILFFLFWFFRPGIFQCDGTVKHLLDTRLMIATVSAKVALSLIHISEPTRLGMISYAVFCLKKKKK